jgi:ribosome-associated protein
LKEDPITTTRKKTTKPKTTAAKTSKSKAAPRHAMHAFILKALEQEKVTDVVSIDLRGKTAIADYMVIASGTSSRQVSAAAQKLRDKLSGEGVKARVEGKDSGDWVIVDAGDVIVHLFRPEVREFYNLEKLWGTDFSTPGYNLYTSN